MLLLLLILPRARICWGGMFSMLRLLLILPEGRIEGRARAALAHQFLGVCVQ